MDFAENYHRWILQLLKPFIGRHLVEVGAGTGSLSKMLLEYAPASLALVEPSEMFRQLRQNIPADNPATEISFYQNVFSNVADEIKAKTAPDTLIYINVMEHIEDDSAELKKDYETLAQKGRVCIFVPAQPWLFSEFDKNIGHFRRYRMNELVEKCRAANFEIVLQKNFDSLGILPWLVKYRWMKSTTMESGAVQAYDRYAVPLLKKMEAVIPPPIGKNILLVGEKK